MSRSDTRSDDIHNSTPGAADARTGVDRHLPSADALKRDARQFLNTAEYEFRKVVGAVRTSLTPQTPDQAPARGAVPVRKHEVPAPEADRE